MRTRLAPYQFVAIHSPYQHFGFYGGVATGKTFTGSHWAIRRITKYPDQTGFIGANTYDQLSQATLREFFYWLAHYGFQAVSDKRPPAAWGEPVRFKDYHNILSVRNPKTGKVTYIFTRVLSDGEPLRGVEFSWYWLDETRDTPQNTHDIVLSRMREDDKIAGIITTTPNGEGWDYMRFVRGNDGTGLYGSMHVPTEQSYRLGIITKNYYDLLRRSYSPLMAAQELDALHINVKGGRAYYSSSDANKKRIAPWGDSAPNPNRPLVVGCDFNFAPAPCVWMVGQVGPNIYAPNGRLWSECVHWFGEISRSEASTPFMTQTLVMQFPGFFYEIYGDASGHRGTTSNAGETDYNQIADTLNGLGCLYSIDANQNNPLVKNRIENMNAMFKNALGEMRQTYNPDTCPLFDKDCRMVGWRKMIGQTGQGKLDDGGDHQLTHATDGAGYAVWKKFPPMGSARMVEALPSLIRQELGSYERFRP